MALTEKYVSALAGGAGTGTIGSPYTFSQMVTEVQAGILGPGTRYNIKADGTYTRSGGDNMDAGGGTNANPVVYRGYKTTIGDGYLGRNAAGALITTNMPFITNPYELISPQKSVWESISYQCTSRNDWAFQLNSHSAMIGCVVNHTGTGSNTCAVEAHEMGIIFECDLSVSSSSGPARCVLSNSQAGVKCDSSRIITASATCDGVQSDWHAGFYGTLLKGAGGGTGIHFNDANREVAVRNCTLAGWTDAIKFDVSTNYPAWICGNMITDNSGWGVNFTTTSCMAIIGPNRTRDNVLGNTNNSTANWLQCGRIIPLVTTDTGGPETDYVNAATNDYNLIPASPGKGVNRPIVSDMGAYGLPDPSGGGGSAVFHPLRNFIIRPA